MTPVELDACECANATCPAVRAGAYVVKEKPCFRCLGTGRLEGAGFTTCPTCNGTGETP